MLLKRLLICMSDRLADGMEALREDAKTGKVFIKGEFSSYNIR